MDNKAELLLHPVRMRILQQVMLEGRITAQQLVERLTEVPPATLYRHLSKLVSGGVLAVVEERPVRGAVEKVYAAQLEQAVATADDLARMTPDDHMKYFTMYVSNLLASYHRYLQGDVDLLRDGVSYRVLEANLTDEEFLQMLTELRAVYAKYMGLEPRADRRGRTIANIIIPEPTPKK